MRTKLLTKAAISTIHVSNPNKKVPDFSKIKANNRDQLANKLYIAVEALNLRSDDSTISTAARILNDDELEILYDHEDWIHNVVNRSHIRSFLSRIENITNRVAIYGKAYDSLVVTRADFEEQVRFWHLVFAKKASATLVVVVEATSTVIPAPVLKRVEGPIPIVVHVPVTVAVKSSIPVEPYVSTRNLTLKMIMRITVNPKRVVGHFKVLGRTVMRNAVKKDGNCRGKVAKRKTVHSIFLKDAKKYNVLMPPKFVHYRKRRNFTIVRGVPILLDDYDK